MQTKNLIQAQANVIKVTSLKKGDTVKIIQSIYSSPVIKFGVVIDMYNTGTDSFVEFLLYDKTYDCVNAEIKIVQGKEDISIFPATPEEVEKHLRDSLTSVSKKIEEKKSELYKLTDAFHKAQEFVSGETSKKLSEPNFESITQDEFDLAQQEKEEAIKEIQDQ